MRSSRLLAAATTAALALTVGAIAEPARADSLHDVLLVGNSVTGTVSFLDGHTFANLGSFSVVPDLQARLAEIQADPIRWVAYQLVRNQEGGDRFADDVAVSPDGRTLYVSRGNLDDAAAFDIASRRMLWRYRLAGDKADHAILSPDGRYFVVSATTAQEVQVIDTATGTLVANAPTGTYPHANDYSPDGRYLYNSSIGLVWLPKALDGLKGDRQVTVIDPATWKVVRKYTFSEGVRPAVFTADNRWMYAQLSYLNGFIEYDLVNSKITRTVTMPYSTAGRALAADSYPNNSAHHGMAISGDATKLCDVGTIDDYTAIIDRPALSTRAVHSYPTGSQPYWATTTVDGQHCAVSLSNANAVSIIDYSTGQETARIPVGTFPQRERLARVTADALTALS
jgi:DNA-binding beta-propeller fold protein YncE